jgi:hypothetical protein
VKEPVFSHSAQRAKTQQEILQRISAQRKKTVATSPSTAVSVNRSQSLSLPAKQPAPLWAQLVGFTLEHPVAVACIATGAVIVGPRRLIRWASIALPWFLAQRY